MTRKKKIQIAKPTAVVMGLVFAELALALLIIFSGEKKKNCEKTDDMHNQTTDNNVRSLWFVFFFFFNKFHHKPAHPLSYLFR
jgi:hypothetical protein